MTREKLLAKLQLCVDDPMWADHVEMPKQLLRVVIEQLGAPAQRARFSDEQLDRAALQLFLLDNNASRWPSVNQVHYRKEAKSILDAALSSTVDQAIEKTGGRAS